MRIFFCDPTPGKILVNLGVEMGVLGKQNKFQLLSSNRMLRCTSGYLKYLMGHRPEAQLVCENHLNISFRNIFYCVSSSSVTQSSLLFIFISCMCFVLSSKVDLACELGKTGAISRERFQPKYKHLSRLDRESLWKLFLSSKFATFSMWERKNI